MAGQSVTLTLADEIDVSRGDMLVPPNNLPHVDHELEAMVVGRDDRLPRDTALYELGEVYVKEQKVEQAREYLQKLVDEYNETYANPFIAAGLGYLDDVIEPADTRRQLIMALNNLRNKKQKLPPKKHGNIPL